MRIPQEDMVRIGSPESGGRSSLRKHFFVDEAGNFDFSLGRGASKYFILTSVIIEDCTGAAGFIDLRRRLAWEGHPLTEAFHCTADKQEVRNQVFAKVAQMDIRVDATIFEKRKTVPHRQDDQAFYKLAWYQHASHLIPSAIVASDELHVVAATIGTKKSRAQFSSAITDVVSQCGRSEDATQISLWSAATDPCLQVADYCCWAIQRKWEMADDRSHVLIKHLIATEYDMWKVGTKYYY